jgi:hypothetical protein
VTIHRGKVLRELFKNYYVIDINAIYIFTMSLRALKGRGNLLR